MKECHNFYSVLCFFLSSLLPVLHIHAFISENSNSDYGLEKFFKFWLFTIMPIAIGAMAVSFLLKPRRNDRQYKTFLYFQYLAIVLSLFTCVLQQTNSFIGPILLSLLAICLLLFAEKVRNNMAQKSDVELSEHLIEVVLKGTVFIGLGQVSNIHPCLLKCLI